MAIRCLRGEARHWWFFDDSMILEKDWCAFSYKLLWKFDPSSKLPEKENESIVDAEENKDDEAVVGLEPEVQIVESPMSTETPEFELDLLGKADTIKEDNELEIMECQDTVTILEKDELFGHVESVYSLFVPVGLLLYETLVPERSSIVNMDHRIYNFGAILPGPYEISRKRKVKSLMHRDVLDFLFGVSDSPIHRISYKLLWYGGFAHTQTLIEVILRGRLAFVNQADTYWRLIKSLSLRFKIASLSENHKRDWLLYINERQVHLGFSVQGWNVLVRLFMVLVGLDFQNSDKVIGSLSSHTKVLLLECFPLQDLLELTPCRDYGEVKYLCWFPHFKNVSLVLYSRQKSSTCSAASIFNSGKVMTSWFKLLYRCPFRKCCPLSCLQVWNVSESIMCFDPGVSYENRFSGITATIVLWQISSHLVQFKRRIQDLVQTAAHFGRYTISVVLLQCGYNHYFSNWRIAWRSFLSDRLQHTMPYCSKYDPYHKFILVGSQLLGFYACLYIRRAQYFSMKHLCSGTRTMSLEVMTSNEVYQSYFSASVTYIFLQLILPNDRMPDLVMSMEFLVPTSTTVHQKRIIYTRFTARKTALTCYNGCTEFESDYKLLVIQVSMEADFNFIAGAWLAWDVTPKVRRNRTIQMPFYCCIALLVANFLAHSSLSILFIISVTAILSMALDSYSYIAVKRGQWVKFAANSEHSLGLDSWMPIALVFLIALVLWFQGSSRRTLGMLTSMTWLGLMYERQSLSMCAYSSWFEWDNNIGTRYAFSSILIKDIFRNRDDKDSTALPNSERQSTVEGYKSQIRKWHQKVELRQTSVHQKVEILDFHTFRRSRGICGVLRLGPNNSLLIYWNQRLQCRDHMLGMASTALLYMMQYLSFWRCLFHYCVPYPTISRGSKLESWLQALQLIDAMLPIYFNDSILHTPLGVALQVFRLIIIRLSDRWFREYKLSTLLNRREGWISATSGVEECIMPSISVFASELISMLSAEIAVQGSSSSVEQGLPFRATKGVVTVQKSCSLKGYAEEQHFHFTILRSVLFCVHLLMDGHTTAKSATVASNTNLLLYVFVNPSREVFTERSWKSLRSAPRSSLEGVQNFSYGSRQCDNKLLYSQIILLSYVRDLTLHYTAATGIDLWVFDPGILGTICGECKEGLEILGSSSSRNIQEPNKKMIEKGGKSIFLRCVLLIILLPAIQLNTPRSELFKPAHIFYGLVSLVQRKALCFFNKPDSISYIIDDIATTLGVSYMVIRLYSGHPMFICSHYSQTGVADSLIVNYRLSVGTTKSGFYSVGTTGLMLSGQSATLGDLSTMQQFSAVIRRNIWFSGITLVLLMLHSNTIILLAQFVREHHSFRNSYFLPLTLRTRSNSRGGHCHIP